MKNKLLAQSIMSPGNLQLSQAQKGYERLSPKLTDPVHRDTGNLKEVTREPLNTDLEKEEQCSSLVGISVEVMSEHPAVIHFTEFSPKPHRASCYLCPFTLDQKCRLREVEQLA